MRLVPVETNPFEETYRLVPVEGDPFAEEEEAQRAAYYGFGEEPIEREIETPTSPKVIGALKSFFSGIGKKEGRVSYMPGEEPMGPYEAEEPVVQPKGALSAAQESAFQDWYRTVAPDKDAPEGPNPDDPRHYYDYRAAWKAGVRGPDETGHWPSQFKADDHPQRFIDGIDTKTGEKVAPVSGVPYMPGEEPVEPMVNSILAEAGTPREKPLMGAGGSFEKPKEKVPFMPGETPVEIEMFSPEETGVATRYSKSENPLLDFAKDTGLDFLKGIVTLQQSVTGMTDIAAGNVPGNLLDTTGYDPDDVIKAIESEYSPVRKEEMKALQEATTAWETVQLIAENPSVGFSTIIQSLPLSMVGAGTARLAGYRLLATAMKKFGIQAGTEKAIRFAQAFFKDPRVIAKIIAAGAAGEGATVAGLMQEEQRRAGKGWAESVPYSIGSGTVTGLISIVSSKIPGMRDAEALIATAGYKTRAGLLATGKEIARTMFKEGILEEWPQEVQEQIWENLALGRPWFWGVGKSGVLGAVAGAGQGTAMALASNLMNPPATGDPDVTPPPEPTVKPSEEYDLLKGKPTREETDTGPPQPPLEPTQGPPPGGEPSAADVIMGMGEEEPEAPAGPPVPPTEPPVPQGPPPVPPIDLGPERPVLSPPEPPIVPEEPPALPPPSDTGVLGQFRPALPSPPEPVTPPPAPEPTGARPEPEEEPEIDVYGFEGRVPYLRKYIDHLATGEKGKRIWLESEPGKGGDRPVMGIKADAPEWFLEGQKKYGWSREQAIQAIENGLAGKKMRPSPKGTGQDAIWWYALEAAKEDRNAEFIEFAREIEESPEMIIDAPLEEYQILLEVLEDEGYSPRIIQEIAAEIRTKSRREIGAAGAELAGISEEEIRRILEDPEIPITIEEFEDELDAQDREFVDRWLAEKEREDAERLRRDQGQVPKARPAEEEGPGEGGPDLEFQAPGQPRYPQEARKEEVEPAPIPPEEPEVEIDKIVELARERMAEASEADRQRFPDELDWLTPVEAARLEVLREEEEILPEGEEKPEMPEEERSDIFFSKAFAERNIPKLEEKIEELHRTLWDSDAFAESEFYDGSFPIPKKGGIVAAKQTKKYESDPAYRKKVDKIVENVVKSIVDANKKRMILIGQPNSGAFGVDYLIKDDPNKAKAGFSVDVGRAWNMEAKSKYPAGYLGDIAIRESLQNSLDAVLESLENKEIKRGDIKITYGNDRKAYEVEDNGIGMSDVDIGDKFLALHGTGKDKVGRFGGFGIAKAVILGPSETSEWELETRDNYFNKDLANQSSNVKTLDPARQGTRIKVQTNEIIISGDAARYVETTEVPKNVDLTLNGEKVKFPFKGRKHKTETGKIKDKTDYTMTYYPNAPDGYESKAIIRLVDKKTGAKLTQGIQDIYNDGFKGTVIIDVETTETPGSWEYPLTDSRMELRWEGRDKLRTLVDRYASDKSTAERVGVQTKSYSLKDRPEWMKTLNKIRKGQDKDFRRLEKTLSDIWKETKSFFGHVYSPTPFTPLDDLLVEIDVGFKGSKGGTSFHARHLAAYEAVARLMSHFAGVSLRDFGVIVSKSINGGIVESDIQPLVGILRLNHLAIDKSALQSVERYAEHLRGTLNHEFTHYLESVHNERFTSLRESMGDKTADAWPYIYRIAEAVLGKEGAIRGRTVVKEKPVEKIVEKPVEVVKLIEKYLDPKQLEFIFENMEKEAIDDNELYVPIRETAGKGGEQYELFGDRTPGGSISEPYRRGRGYAYWSRDEFAGSQVAPEGDEAGLEFRRGDIAKADRGKGEKEVKEQGSLFGPTPEEPILKPEKPTKHERAAQLEREGAVKRTRRGKKAVMPEGGIPEVILGKQKGLFETEPQEGDQIELDFEDLRTPPVATPGGGPGKPPLEPIGLEQEVDVETTGNIEAAGYVVEDAGDVAAFMDWMAKEPQEAFYGIIADKDGKILEIHKFFKGGKIGANVNVDVVVGRVLNIPGAKKAYFVHNHPGGKTSPSSQDMRLLHDTDRYLAAQDIDTVGVIVARDKYGTFWPDQPEDSIPIPKKIKTTKLPVKERVFVKMPGAGVSNVHNPDDVRALIKDRFDNDPGVLFLNRDNQPVGYLKYPVGRERKELTKAILGASEKTNASAIVIYAGDKNFADLPKGREDYFKELVQYLKYPGMHDVSILDVLDVVAGTESFAGLGQLETIRRRADSAGGGKGAVSTEILMNNVPKGAKGGKGLPVKQVQLVINNMKKEWRNPPDEIKVVRNVEDIPEKYIREAIYGFRTRGVFARNVNTGKRKVYLIASNLESTREVTKVLMHEALGHDGLRQALGYDVYNFLDQVYKDHTAAVEDVAKRYGVDTSTAAGRREAADEWMAWSIANETLPEKIWAKIAHAIRAWVRKVFPRLEVSAAEARELARMAIQEGQRFRGGLVQTGRAGVNEFAQDAAAPIKEATEKITDNPAFKRWFGDSKLVDENGEPLVVYHGTKSDEGFTKFGEGIVPGVVGFFSESEKYAYEYTDYLEEEPGQIMSVYLKINNPFDITSLGESYKEVTLKELFDAGGVNLSQKDIEHLKKAGYSLDSKNPAYAWIYEDAHGDIISLLKEKGFDGITQIERDMNMEESRSWAAFHPTQIKSIFNTTFDPTNPDIRYQKEPEPEPVKEVKEEAPLFGEVRKDAVKEDLLDEDGLLLDDARIDPSTKAIMKGGLGLFESGTDRLRRSKVPAFVKLADKVENFFNMEAARIGWVNGRMRPILKNMTKAERKKFDEDFKLYFKHHDNGREKVAQMILKENPRLARAVEVIHDLFDEMGAINQALGVQVYDTKINGWRLIGKIAKGDFWPRTLAADVQAVLSSADARRKNPELWRKLVDALIDEGHIKERSEALKYLHDYFRREVINDYFAGIEKARGKKLPEIFYDYGWNAFMRYSHKWAKRISQIEQFGQKTTDSTKDAFERARDFTSDYTTKQYIAALADRVYDQRSLSPYTYWFNILNLAATGLQLGNPGTALLNLLGGTTLNVQMFGWRRVAQAYAELLSEWNKVQQEGVELGILQKDMLRILRDSEAEAFSYYNTSDKLTKKLGKFSEWTMKWGGYTPTENIIRATAYVAAKRQLEDALKTWNTKGMNNAKAKKYLGFMSRNNIDARKLILENGRGEETAKYLRKMVNIPQGSYRVDMVPIYADTVEGRFLFKYQKFTTQVTRMFWQNMLKPFVSSVIGGEEVYVNGKKVQVKGKDVRVKTFLPLFRYFAAAFLGGTAILAARSAMFGYLDPGPDWDELEKALENDETALKWAFLFSRLYASLMGASAFGFFGNYIQMGLDVADQQRVKNPLDPPGLATVDLFIDIMRRVFMEQKTVTARDFDDVATKGFAFYRAYKRLAASAFAAMGAEFKEVELEMARRDVGYVREAARRYADQAGIAARRLTIGKIARTERSPINQKIYEALILGNGAQAREIVRDAMRKEKEKDKPKLKASMQASMRARQPILFGGTPSEEEKKAFMRWARETLPASKYQLIKDVTKRYDKAAERAGLKSIF